MKIPQEIRADILRYLKLAPVPLPDGEDGLSLWDDLFNLSKLPSSDSRFSDAHGDAWQHTVNNYDWDPDWILTDSRINILSLPDVIFAKFVDGIVNWNMNEPQRQAPVVDRLNSVLRPRGFELIKARSLGEFSEYRLSSKAATSANNQGRAHSANPAPLEYDGLHFRSRFEVALYRELKTSEFVFAPLPVLICPRRIEPDFVVLHKGLVFVVEVDGQHTHQETPVAAQQRLEDLEMHGAFVIRVLADGEANAEWAKKTLARIKEAIRRRLELK
jgi:hypothetical protein